MWLNLDAGWMNPVQVSFSIIHYSEPLLSIRAPAPTWWSRKTGKGVRRSSALRADLACLPPLRPPSAPSLTPDQPLSQVFAERANAWAGLSR